MSAAESRDYLRQFYFGTGFFTQEEEAALEFIWNPASLTNLQQQIAAKYSVLDGEKFAPGYASKFILGEVDANLLLTSTELFYSVNFIVASYNSAFEKIYDLFPDYATDLDSPSLAAVNDLVANIQNTFDRNWLEKYTNQDVDSIWNWLKAIGEVTAIQAIQAIDLVGDSIPNAIELTDVIWPQVGLTKSFVEEASLTVENAADILATIELIIDATPILVDAATLILKGDGSPALLLDILEVTESIEGITTSIPQVESFPIFADLIEAFLALSKASEISAIQTEVAFAETLLDRLEFNYVLDGIFEIVSFARRVGDALDGPATNPVTEWADVFFTALETGAGRYLDEYFGLYLAKQGEFQSVYSDYNQLVDAYNVLDSEVIGGFEFELFSTDGPSQASAGALFNSTGLGVGVVSLESSTFVADGDAEYTVSLASVGQGLQYNIAYIIDVSPSMIGQKFVDAKNAYIELTNQLKAIGIAEVANFAVIPFDFGSTLYADLTADEAIDQISSLSIGNGTTFGPALSDAQAFFSSANNGQTNVAYLLSDGQGNGASDALTSDANVQAFGIGSGADLNSLDIIDSDNAVALSSSSQLVDVLTGSSVDISEVDRIEIWLDAELVETILPDQLVDTPLGQQFTGTLSGLDVSAGAENELRATVFLMGGDVSGEADLTIASALSDTSIIENDGTTNVTLGAFNTSYDVDASGSSAVFFLGNNLDNSLTATNTGGTFSLFGGNDYMTSNSTIDSVIDGGSGYDTVEYFEDYSTGDVREQGSVLKVGANSDTLTNVEEIRFSNGNLLTGSFEFYQGEAREGTDGRDRLTGSDDFDSFRSLAGRQDLITGGADADQFIFGAEVNNGIRERDIISDYEVGVDEIVLEDGAYLVSIQETSNEVIVFVGDDRDTIYVRGDDLTAANISIITEDVFDFV